ncbi:MAG TPA: VWA domain-containing protein [Pyrinomonadaceae bacterium]|nr:VWA domain-containing protein [Pyrinomonadaceae bacterium]
MLSTRRIILLFIAALVFFTFTPPPAHAQSGRTAPRPTPTPQEREPQEPIRVFTEEVRLPISVTDNYGRFDPTLEIPDIIVLEDDEMQEVRSVRRIPANVLLVLDTSGGINPVMRTNTTRDVALSIVSALRPGDQLALIQAGDRVETLQDWTSDTESLKRVLKAKLSSGRKKRISESLIEAARQLKERPAGSRHVVLITDGVEANDKSYWEAVRQLNAAQVTVYVISYTAMGRDAIKKNAPLITYGGPPPRTANDTAREADPTIPVPRPNINIATIDTDREMRRKRKEYSDATIRSEERLTVLAEETGGRIMLPKSEEEMRHQGREVARDIGAQYVVTYKPKRPLASSAPGEFRRIKVALRRQGLTVRSRNGYTVPAQQ